MKQAKTMLHYLASVWYTIESATGETLLRKCCNADTDTEAFAIAKRLHQKGATEIRIRKAYTNEYQRYCITENN